MNIIPINPLMLMDYQNLLTVIPFMFFILMLGHFLADYPLQGDFLSKAKNRYQPIQEVPWWQAMTAHCGIHAGFVMIITGSIFLGIMEFIAHFCIDSLKCAGKINYNEDQYFHILCKIFILIIWIGTQI